MNPDEFYPDPRERKKFNWTYGILAVGLAIIVAHYTIVLPFLASKGI